MIKPKCVQAVFECDRGNITLEVTPGEASGYFRYKAYDGQTYHNEPVKIAGNRLEGLRRGLRYAEHLDGMGLFTDDVLSVLLDTFELLLTPAKRLTWSKK